jgi:hypothetical protein
MAVATMTRCSICRHEARVDIDAALTRATPISTVARDFGVGRSSLTRHAQAHLAVALARVVQPDDPRTAVLHKASELHQYCRSLLARAEAMVLRHPDRPRSITATSAVIRETRQTLMMVAERIADAGRAPTEPQPEPFDLEGSMLRHLLEDNAVWELADGTIEYAPPCPHCRHRNPPSGPLRDAHVFPTLQWRVLPPS